MEPLRFVLPVVYAALLWWFTTGLIMAVYRSSRLIIRGWFVAATVVMLGASVALFYSAQSGQLINVYISYTCGVIIWGWVIAAYYLNFVTGLTYTPTDTHATPTVKPTGKSTGNVGVAEVDAERHALVDTTLVDTSRVSCPNPVVPHSHRASTFATFSVRFRRAVQSSLHHELLAIGMGLVIALITLPQPNRWGLWIYLTLWFMHTSAKLNVFFGVRNFRVDFLPSHLHYLEHLIVRRSSNAFFPFSICLASSVTLALFYRAIMPNATEMQSVGSILLVTMLVLGIIEHWLLVIPLPAVMWGWGVRELPPTDVPEFRWEEVPFLYSPALTLLMAKWRESVLYKPIDNMTLPSVAHERNPSVLGQLSKSVIES